LRSAFHGVARIGAAYLVPAVEAAAADGLELGVAGRGVPEQNVGRFVAKVFANTDDGVTGIRPADLFPAEHDTASRKGRPFFEDAAMAAAVHFGRIPLYSLEKTSSAAKHMGVRSKPARGIA
jgi:hypothetical protein